MGCTGKGPRELKGRGDDSTEPTGPRSEATREGGPGPREPKGAAADWTEERRRSDEGRRPGAPRAEGRAADWTEERSDEGRRRGKSARRRAGILEHSHWLRPRPRLAHRLKQLHNVP